MKKLHLTALVLGSGLALGSGVALAGGPGCGHGGAARFGIEQMDSNKDGKVTLAELQQGKQTWFASVDANKDGVADTAELTAKHDSERAAHLDQMFEKQDSNKDGRLTADETHMPPRFFERVDANKDGAITKEEMTASKPGRDGKGTRHLGPLDANKDGQITRQEALDSAAQMLEHLDTNKDGALTADELKAGHGKRHGGKHEEGKDAPSQTRS
jgi:Ca2+-binding EF-hand superfamily protein